MTVPSFHNSKLVEKCPSKWTDFKATVVLESSELALMLASVALSKARSINDLRFMPCDQQRLRYSMIRIKSKVWATNEIGN